jgi:hypothetical protein
VDGDAMASLVELLRALADAPASPDGSAQARAFDFRGRLTKLVLSREALVRNGAPDPALLQRYLDAGVARPAGLQLVLPERVCRGLPVDLQAALRRRFGSAARIDPARSRALPAPPHGTPTGTKDTPRLALEALCRWIQDHGQHFDGHPAHTMSSPLYGVYREGELIGVSLRLATRLLARFMQGDDPNALWVSWRARGWLRHEPGHLTLRLAIGDQRRRWLALTWGAWELAIGEHSSRPTREGSRHEADSAESRRAASQSEPHAGPDAPPGRG